MSVEMTERKLSYAEEMRARAAANLHNWEHDKSLAPAFVAQVKKLVCEAVDSAPRKDFLIVHLPQNMTSAQLEQAKTLLESKENGFDVTPLGGMWNVSWKK
jgi:hypothetical protein